MDNCDLSLVIKPQLLASYKARVPNPEGKPPSVDWGKGYQVEADPQQYCLSPGLPPLRPGWPFRFLTVGLLGKGEQSCSFTSRQRTAPLRVNLKSFYC